MDNQFDSYASLGDDVVVQRIGEPGSPLPSFCVKAVPGQIVAEFHGPDAKQLAHAFCDLWNTRTLVVI